MKTQSLYISPLGLESGAVVVSFGLMGILKRNYKKVAFFRPIVFNIPNNDIDLIVNNFKLEIPKNDCIGISATKAQELISNNQTNKLYEILIEKYEKLKSEYDFVLIQGVSIDSLSFSLDFDINLQIAKNFDTQVIGVLNGKDKNYKQLKDAINIEANNIKKSNCTHFATFVNRVNKQLMLR